MLHDLIAFRLRNAYASPSKIEFYCLSSVAYEVVKFNIKLIALPFYVLVIFLFDLCRRKAHV